MPYDDRHDRAVATAGMGRVDPAAFAGTEYHGSVRVWGRLRQVSRTAASRPAGYTEDAALDLDVDRVEADPPFLPPAVAPTTPAAWASWALAAGSSGALVGAACRLVRRLSRVRFVALTVATASLAVAVAVVGPWACVPGVGHVYTNVGGRTVEAVFRSGSIFTRTTATTIGVASTATST